MRLARTAATAADGLYLVIPTDELNLPPPSSPLQTSSGGPRHASDEVRRGEPDTSTERNSRTLRSVRAQVACAAGESALAAQFQARLVMLSDEELQVLCAQLETALAARRGHRTGARGQADGAIEDGGAERAVRAASMAAAAVICLTTRFQERFAHDLVTAMRICAEGTVQLRLDGHDVAGGTTRADGVGER